MGLTTNLKWSRISSINMALGGSTKKQKRIERSFLVITEDQKLVISGGITGIMSLRATWSAIKLYIQQKQYVIVAIRINPWWSLQQKVSSWIEVHLRQKTLNQGVVAIFIDPVTS